MRQLKVFLELFPSWQFPPWARNSPPTRSQCCPLISHYPLYFKSIVNYLQNALSLSCYKWAALGRLKFPWLKDLLLHGVKTVLPLLLLLIGPSGSILFHSSMCSLYFSHSFSFKNCTATRVNFIFWSLLKKKWSHGDAEKAADECKEPYGPFASALFIMALSLASLWKILNVTGERM